MPQVLSHEPGSRPQADEPGQPQRPGPGRLGIGECKLGGNLGLRIGGLGALARQRRRSCLDQGRDPEGDVAQVGPASLLPSNIGAFATRSIVRLAVHLKGRGIELSAAVVGVSTLFAAITSESNRRPSTTAGM
jgi:hypothetical protein